MGLLPGVGVGVGEEAGVRLEPSEFRLVRLVQSPKRCLQESQELCICGGWDGCLLRVVSCLMFPNRHFCIGRKACCCDHMRPILLSLDT